MLFVLKKIKDNCTIKHSKEFNNIEDKIMIELGGFEKVYKINNKICYEFFNRIFPNQ